MYVCVCEFSAKDIHIYSSRAEAVFKMGFALEILLWNGLIAIGDGAMVEGYGV